MNSTWIGLVIPAYLTAAARSKQFRNSTINQYSTLQITNAEPIDKGADASLFNAYKGTIAYTVPLEDNEEGFLEKKTMHTSDNWVPNRAQAPKPGQYPSPHFPLPQQVVTGALNRLFHGGTTIAFG